MDNKELLTPKEVAALSGYALGYVYKMIEGGVLPATRRIGGKRVFIEKQLLDRFLRGEPVCNIAKNR